MNLSLDDFDQIKVSGGGKFILAKCLWHDDNNPSMIVYHDGFFICKGCGEQGGWAKLYKRMHEVAGTTPTKPLGGGRLLPRLPKTLAAQRKLAAEAHAALMGHRSLGWYVQQRHLDHMIAPLGLGWWEGWITIPVRDREGIMQGLVLRATPNIQRQYNMRFMTPPGQPPQMYVPNWKLLETEPCIFVCYGMFDAPSIAALGFAAATTTAGKDSFRPEWLDAYRKPVYIIGDVGEELAALRPADGLDWRHRRLTLAYPKDVKDPNDFLMTFQEEKLYDQLNAARTAVHIENKRILGRLQRKRPTRRAVPA
jgi:DNA primase